MAMFTDTVTIYNKVADTEWKRTVVRGVQWSDRIEKKNDNGKLSLVKYTQITFPSGTYENLTLNPENEEDVIVYGEVSDKISEEKGNRISDLLAKYQKSGFIQSTNDNSGRDFLKCIKVVIA